MIGTITIISKIGTREKTGSFINNKDNTPVIPPQNQSLPANLCVRIQTSSLFNVHGTLIPTK